MDTLLPLADKIAIHLKDRRETIAIAKSSTGGLISAALLSVPGASAYFLGGAVVYTRQARSALVGISEADMTGMRAASEPYAALLARTVRERHGATWGLSETGATGPTGNRYGDPAGHTCIGFSGPDPARSHCARAAPTANPTCAPSPPARSRSCSRRWREREARFPIAASE